MTKLWFQNLTDLGLRPYVATARHQLGGLDLAALGSDPLIATLEDSAAREFHEAYNVANALAFGARNLTMPGWVYIDCVLMQTGKAG